MNKKIKKYEDKKMRSIKINKILADYYEKEHQVRKAKRIRECSNYLVFRSYFDAENTQKLHKANFCEHPLCLMCSWRLHLKRHRELLQAIKILEREDVENRFYFLTLTVQNWERMSNGRLKDLQKKAIKFIRTVLNTTSYYISTEITVSKDGTYHPHIHAIIHSKKEVGTQLRDITLYRRLWASIYSLRHHKYLLATLYPVQAEETVMEVTKYILKPEKQISSKFVINIANSIQGLKKGFSSGEIRKALKTAKFDVENDILNETDKLERFNWREEYYKWVNNKYLLENES